MDTVNLVWLICFLSVTMILKILSNEVFYPFCYSVLIQIPATDEKHEELTNISLTKKPFPSIYFPIINESTLQNVLISSLGPHTPASPPLTIRKPFTTIYLICWRVIIIRNYFSLAFLNRECFIEPPCPPPHVVFT